MVAHASEDPVKRLCGGVVIDPSGRHAYVTNIYGNDVAVVDMPERRVVARVPVGEKPNGMSFSSLTVPAESRATVDLGLGGGGDGMQGMDHDS